MKNSKLQSLKIEIIREKFKNRPTRGVKTWYNISMYNWSVDEKYLAQFPQKYKLWKIEQLLSYGLEGEKVSKTEIVENWDYLKKRLDPKRRQFLEYIIWGKLS